MVLGLIPKQLKQLQLNVTKLVVIILSEIWSYGEGYKIAEIKSIFKNRIRGESSVNQDILESLTGLIMFLQKIFKLSIWDL